MKKKTIDILTSNLCEKIDQLKEDRDYWKQKFEEEQAKYSQFLNERISQSKRDLGNALMFALSTTDNEKGDLVITQEKRETLAKNWNQ
mgnify:CR=1 FL=1